MFLSLQTLLSVRLSAILPAGVSKFAPEHSGIIKNKCFQGGSLLHLSLAVNIVGDPHVSQRIGSDVVFIALALAHLREVWIECLLTKRHFPPKPLRCCLKGFCFAQDPDSFLCFPKSRVTQPESGCGTFD